MRILLDSNAYTLFARRDDGMTELVRDADEVLMSAVVVGELLFGFRNGTRREQNLAFFGEFLNRPYVTFLPIRFATARFYGEIAASLKAMGRPIPTNDVWIAAHAFETGAELVSADSDFEAVEDLVWRRINAK